MNEHLESKFEQKCGAKSNQRAHSSGDFRANWAC